MNDNGPIWNQIAGNWKQFMGSVRERWGELTDDEIMEINGKRDHLAGKIQEKYGIVQEEANRQIEEWSDKLKF
jgi:uncharacterized protein YjbJ (UPF0337 family)